MNISIFLKKTVLVSCFTCILCLTAFSQLKVINSGQVGIGTYAPTAKLEVWDNFVSEMRLWSTPDGEFQGVSRYWAANILYAYGFGVDEYGDGHVYFDMNKPGITLTFKNADTHFGNFNVEGKALPYSNNWGCLGSTNYMWRQGWITNVYTYGVSVLSDANLKTNIKDLKGGLSYIKKLRGVTYDFNDEARTKYLGNDKKIGNNEFGFLAQEVKKVLPNLVVKSSDSSDVLYINYIGFIPILVQSVKELDSLGQIKDNNLNILKGEIEDLKNKIAILEEVCLKDKKAVSDPAVREESVLYQNMPNPFNVETKIRYNIAPSVSDATVYVYNLQGVMERTIRINSRGEGVITIMANGIKPGIYYYSLYTNGKEVDTKKMVITE